MANFVDPKNNMLNDNIKIPESWTKQSQIKTRTELVAKRKQDNMPDPTFDLDGDGYVGPRDYFISRKFDLDGDGKLNSTERRKALEALQNGFEQEFLWGLESTGGNNQHRVVQIRGQIVNAEDFTGMEKTYPKYSPSDKVPNYKSLSDMKNKRLQLDKQHIEQKIKDFEARQPPSIELEYRDSEFLVQQPNFRTLTEKKQSELKQHRVKMGLTDHPQSIDPKNEPGLSYVPNPQFKTKKELEQWRKSYDVQTFQNVFDNAQHKDVDAKIREREECNLRLIYKAEDGPTLRKLKEHLRQMTIAENTEKFAHKALGVHGQELPKFSETQEAQKYWKLQPRYQDRPQHQSLKKMKEEQVHWMKNSTNSVAQKRNSINDKEFIRKTRKDQVIDKVTTINYYLDKEFDLQEHKASKGRNTKWTEDEHIKRFKKVFELPNQVINTQEPLNETQADTATVDKQSVSQSKHQVLDHMNQNFTSGSPNFKISRNDSPYGIKEQYASPQNNRKGLLRYSFYGQSPAPQQEMLMKSLYSKNAQSFNNQQQQQQHQQMSVTNSLEKIKPNISPRQNPDIVIKKPNPFNSNHSHHQNSTSNLKESSLSRANVASIRTRALITT